MVVMWLNTYNPFLIPVTPGLHALSLPIEFSVGFLSEDRSGQQAISMPCDPDVHKQECPIHLSFNGELDGRFN